MDDSHSKTNCESDDSINSFLYFSNQTIICPQQRDIKLFVSPVVEVTDRKDRDRKPFSDKMLTDHTTEIQDPSDDTRNDEHGGTYVLNNGVHSEKVTDKQIQLSGSESKDDKLTILFTTHFEFQKNTSNEVVDKAQNLKIAKSATDIFKLASDYNLESCEQIVDQKIEGKDDLCCDTSLRSENSNEINKQSITQPHQQSETTCYLMMENMLSAHEPLAEQCVNQAIQGALSQFQQLYEAMYFSEMESLLLNCFQLSKLPQEIALVSFGIGLVCYEQKKYEDAIQYLRESEGKLQEYYRHDPDPTHLSDISLCRVYMGEVESAQSHYSAAIEHFLEAVKTHQIQPSVLQQSFQLPELSLCAKILKLALALHCDNQVTDSERYYRKALLCDDATSSDIISAKTSLGNLLHSVGDHERAVEEYIVAIEKAEIENDALSQAWTHGNLGNTYLSLGKYEQGLYHLQKSLELTTIHEPTPSAISRALNNLGTAYQALSKLDEAESYYDEALSQAIYGNDQIGQARAYGNIGNLYMLQKNQERAIPHYTEVLRLSKDRSTVYVAYHNQGCAFFDLAEKRKKRLSNRPRREYQYIAWGPNTSDLECKLYQDELEDNIVQLYKQGFSDFKKVIINDQTSCEYNDHERPPEPEQFDNVFVIDDKDDDISKASLIFTESIYNLFDNDIVSVESLLSDTHYNRQNKVLDQIKVTIACNDCKTDRHGVYKLPSVKVESVPVLIGEAKSVFGKSFKATLSLVHTHDDICSDIKQRTKLSTRTREVRARARRRAEEKRKELCDSSDEDT